tara:strand:- start:7208 stop:8389 length:1182 start_codon:yes stop_codon:yes gene_type:complete
VGFIDECSIQNSIRLQFTYGVYFSYDVFNLENLDLVNIVSKIEPESISAMSVFVDQGVLDSNRGLLDKIFLYFQTYRTRLRLLGEPLALPGGEGCKTDPIVLESIYKQLLKHNIDRHSFVLAIGGGAVLDTVGYAAATAHRGVRLMRMPSTALAQNDAGIGVKTGVNRYGKKNFIGAFAAPFAVINDSSFLSTLSERDRRSGIAEAIKVALIRDQLFFEWLEANVKNLIHFDNETTLHMIKWCADLHLSQITKGGDPFETGSSRPLDFGHWAAHKLESMSMFELRHGEAVAIGIAIDTKYSLDSHRITNKDCNRIMSLLNNLGFELIHPEMTSRKENGELVLLDGIEEFREHLGGELTITMLDSIGSGVEIHNICRNTMEQAVTYLASKGKMA